MFDMFSVMTAPVAATAAATGTSCPGLQAVNPLCYAVGAVGSIGGSVASAGVDAVLGGLSQWVASGAEWLLSQIGNVLISRRSTGRMRDNWSGPSSCNCPWPCCWGSWPSRS